MTSCLNSSVPSPSLLWQNIVAQNTEEALELLRTNAYCPDIEMGKSNLQAAIMHCPGHSKLIEALIVGRGIDVLEFADSYGNTPMMTAAGMADVVAIDLLAKAGAKVCVHNTINRDPLCVVVMSSLLRIHAMFDDQEHAHAQVLEAARTLVRHGAPVDVNYYGFKDKLKNGKPLLRNYVSNLDAKWIDPNLVKFLVAAGADIPSQEELLQIHPTHSATIYAAIEHGLEDRRITVARELGATIPSSLVALIRGYVA
jgi:ankyrin repeat protein